jgi:hypothetical protein
VQVADNWDVILRGHVIWLFIFSNSCLDTIFLVNQLYFIFQPCILSLGIWNFICTCLHHIDEPFDLISCYSFPPWQSAVSEGTKGCPLIPLIPCRRNITCIRTLAPPVLCVVPGCLLFWKALVGWLSVRVRFLCHRVRTPRWPSHYGTYCCRYCCNRRLLLQLRAVFRASLKWCWCP